MDAEGSASSNPYVAQVIDYITEHLTEDIAIADIAEVLHLNAQYIMRLFKKEVGCPVLQYITAKRIALAVRYLTETNISVIVSLAKTDSSYSLTVQYLLTMIQKNLLRLQSFQLILSRAS